MHAHRNITYRLVPGTAVRARKLASTAGACRYVWNTVLADQQGLYLSARAAGAEPLSVSFFTLGQAYTQLRRVTPWLQELPFAPIRYTLKYQADAWQRFFRGQGGRPRFKARRGDDRVTFPGGSFRIEGDVVRLARIGPMRLRRRGGNPYPDGVPKQVAVKRVGKRWHAVVCYEVEVGERREDGRALGIDMNVGQVATSDGAVLRLPVSSRLVARHRRQQRVAARRRKGSRRRLRMVRRAARTARKLALRRRNWQHHVSRRQHVPGRDTGGGGPAGPGHDGLREGHGRAARDECAAEGRAEPVHPAHRVGRSQANARIQGGDRRRRRSGLQQPDLPCVRARERGVASVPGAVQVCVLRTRGACGRERGPQHPGPGDGGDWTARSVGAGHSADPSTGIGSGLT